MKSSVSLVCFNPQGRIEVPTPSGLINPRMKDLEGKRIAIIWDGKKGGDKFCMVVEELLKEKYSTATTIRLVWGDAEAAEKAKKEMDTFIYGVADNGMGGWIQCRQVIALEKLGKPGVFVIGDNAAHTSKMSVEDAGMPTVRIVSLPSIDYYPNRSTVDDIRPVAELSLNRIIDALTKPLTAEEKSPPIKDNKKTAPMIEITEESYEGVLESFNKLYVGRDQTVSR
jgi:hypothetical protein